jgi:hypothetical protein
MIVWTPQISYLLPTILLLPLVQPIDKECAPEAFPGSQIIQHELSEQLVYPFDDTSVSTFTASQKALAMLYLIVALIRLGSFIIHVHLSDTPMHSWYKYLP